MLRVQQSPVTHIEIQYKWRYIDLQKYDFYLDIQNFKVFFLKINHYLVIL